MKFCFRLCEIMIDVICGYSYCSTGRPLLFQCMYMHSHLSLTIPGQTKLISVTPLLSYSNSVDFAWACEWLCMGSPTCFSKRKLLCKCCHFLPMLVNFYIFDKYLYVYEFFITNEEINSNIKSLKLITSSG